MVVMNYRVGQYLTASLGYLFLLKVLQTVKVASFQQKLVNCVAYLIVRGIIDGSAHCVVLNRALDERT